MTISSIFGSIVNNFSVLYLSFFFLPSVVGLYGIASKIGIYIDLVTGSISAILIPMFSAALASREISKKLGNLYNYSIYFGLLFAMPIVVYVSIFSHAMVISVFTSTYKGSSIYMALIGIGILVGLLASYASSLAISSGHIREVFEYGILISLAELLSFLVLIPFFGVTGLIISIYYIGSIIANILYLHFVSKKLHLKIQINLSRLVASNIVLALLLLPIAIPNIRATYQLLLGLIVLFFIYPALLGLFKAISNKELELLRKIVIKLPIFGNWLNALIIYAEIFQR